jgi:uncharacterized membrane protein
MMNNQTSRFSALVAYLLPVLGWLYVLIFQRKDRFALYHAKQAAMITIVAILAPLVWLVGGWLLMFLPYGAILAMALFSLVIAIYFFLLYLCILGMANVSQTKIKRLPLIGEWGEQLPIE